MKHLAYHCVTMNELMDKFYENTDLSDLICEKCPKFSGKMSKEIFEKHQSVLNPPMQIRTFLKIPGYNGLRDEYFKNKAKIALPSQYYAYFSVSHDEVVYILVSINIDVGKDMDSGQYICDVLDYNTGHGGYLTME